MTHTIISAIKRASLLLAVATTLAGCSDFLDLPSKTTLSTEVFYKSQSDFEQGLNGAYAILRDLYQGPDGAWAMGELRSDNTIYAYNPNDRGTIQPEFINNFIEEANNTVILHKYVCDYSIISNINYLLEPIDGANFDSQAKANIKGQALFLRAFAYLDLVEYFGNVPMHLSAVRSLKGAAEPLMSADSVYSQIIADATEATRLLPDKATQEPGRATSGAAHMLLANVYINQKQWAKAQEELSQVTGYELMENYADVFDPNHKNNAESVFEVQYKQGNEGLNSYFFYTFMAQPITAEEVTAITGIPEVARIVEGYNIPTPDIINAYEDGDLRKAASIGVLKAHGVAYPYIKKYCHPHELSGNTNDNWPVYRYSEALLFMAEALNEQGRTADAAKYIDQVRLRAGLANTTATTQADMRVAIEHERRVELAFENKRWLDLVRSGKAETTMKAFGVQVKAHPENYYFPEGYGPAPQSFTTISLRFPLPASEAALTVYF